MDTYIVPFCSLFNCISSTQFMFFFYLWQSTRTWLLYRSPYCFWLPHFSATCSPPSEVSKLQQPISNTWCNDVAFYHSGYYLCYGIGRDKPTKSQHKLPPFTQACVSHFWSFCLRLAAVDSCTFLWMVHPCFMCMHFSTITLQLTPTDSPMLSTNFPIDQSVYFSGIQQIVWPVPK